MKYFDAVTGLVLDDVEQGSEIGARLAQRHALVPVEGRALEVVEAGNEAVGEPDEVEDTSRPPAAEDEGEAKKNFEAEEEARQKAQATNVAAVGSGIPSEDEEPEAKPDDARQSRREKAAKEKSKTSA